MGQQLRARAKRKRRKAYLDRHKAKASAPRRETSRTTKTKKAAP